MIKAFIDRLIESLVVVTLSAKDTVKQAKTAYSPLG